MPAIGHDFCGLLPVLFASRERRAGTAAGFGRFHDSKCSVYRALIKKHRRWAVLCVLWLSGCLKLFLVAQLRQHRIVAQVQEARFGV